MKYVFAFDGGGTKTRMNVVDLEGNILFDKITEGSNIMAVGDEHFVHVISTLFLEGKNTLHIQDEDIAFVFLGLSGADLESDYQRLNNVCKKIFGSIRYKVVNDAWIILRSGLDKPYGAVCICGTGTNSAAINHQGKQAIMRALGYTTGTFGGGLDIARDAFHYAYRSEEKTFKQTMLETEIPKFLGKKDLSECVELVYPRVIIPKQQFGEITGLVNECAVLGDEVSNMILENVATHIAYQTCGVMKQVGICSDVVPVVVGGRVFSSKAPIFMETFQKTMSNLCPNSYIVLPIFTPVVGAYLFALDELGIEQTKEIQESLMKSGGKL